MLYVFSTKILLAFVERISKVVPIVDMYYIDNDIVFSFSPPRLEGTIYEHVPVLKWITITLYNMRGKSLVSFISSSHVHKTINLHKHAESISKSDQKLQQLSVYICNIEVKLNQSVCCSSEFEYYFWESESFNTLQFSDANTPATLTAWQSLFDFALIINDVNQIYTRL